MGLPVEINPLFVSSTAGYTVGRSLRFRSSASAYLNRTPAAASNRKTWTWSGWVKRGAITAPSCLFSAGGGSPWGQISFTSDGSGNGIDCSFTAGVSAGTRTNALFRDPSAWYHVLVAVDTTQATDTNRIKIYVNGVLQTLAFTNYPAQNFDTQFNNTVAHRLGANGNTSAAEFFDGYQAEVNFIDGQALTPSSFGAYDTNGVWQPIKYTGTYGTNGFYLPFSNTTSTTTLVQDSSGNGNNWTPNNISLTAGTTYDSMIDSPTVSASSSNYCVMNPLLSGQVNTNAEGNLYVYSPTGSTSGSNVIGTMSVSSGKWYFEATFWQSGTTSFGPQVGITNNLDSTSQGGQTGSYAYIITGQKQSNGTGTAYGSSYTTNDVIGVAFDLDAGTLTFYKNNVSQGTAFTGLSGTFFPFARNVREAAYSSGYYYNFGQRPFTYTPPTGFKALNTYNLPAPSIANGAQYMAATLWSGNNVNGTAISNSQSNGGNNPLGTTFAPDLVWVKSRSGAYYNMFQDTVRGAGKSIFSNVTDAESGNSGDLLGAFQSTGFTVNRNYTGQTTNPTTNNSGDTYVGWQWKAGGSSSSNTSGSITSTVSANTTAGFSVVTFTGTGANATVGHGLGVAPSMIIAKNRSSAGTGWPVYHSNLTSAAYFLELQSTNGQVSAPTVWNSTAPTSSVFSIGTAFSNTSNYVAYCFAAIKGYSAFGTYTGNGSSTDGPFIYTGFRPRWLMIKRTDTTDDWPIEDSSRNLYNVDTQYLLANTSGAEGTVNLRDLLSNGFKVRAVAQNANGGTYVYAAFAENPFNYSRAR